MDGDMSMPQTQAKRDLDELRRRRAELRESLGAVEDALAAPGARAVVWGERVHTALLQLADDFAVHVTVTEGSGGLHEQILEGDLRLANAVGVLAEEHVQLAADIADLVHATDAPVGAEDIAPVRDQAMSVLGMLIRHRQRGADLIYEAFDTDIGGGG